MMRLFGTDGIRGTAGTAPLDRTTVARVGAALVRSSEPVDVDGLRTGLKERLSAYKVPRVIKVVPDAEVPMMSSGKVDLRGLREVLGGA